MIHNPEETIKNLENKISDLERDLEELNNCFYYLLKQLGNIAFIDTKELLSSKKGSVEIIEDITQLKYILVAKEQD